MVRLQPELALQRAQDRALDAALAVDSRAAELRVDEELAIENCRRRVERRARDARIDVILCGDGVCNEEPNDLELVKATSIVETGQDLVDGVCRTVSWAEMCAS